MQSSETGGESRRRRRLRNVARIARTEWTRHRRERRRARTWTILVLVAVAAITVGLGTVGYVAGRGLATERETIRVVLPAVTSVAFVVLVWTSAQVVHDRFERLDRDLLLTTVPVGVAARGLLTFVFVRVGARVALPAVGIAVGAAVGLGSPLVAPSVLGSITALTTLAVAVGATGRLAAHLVGRRFVHAGTVRDLVVVFGWLPLVGGALVLRETGASLTPLLAAIRIQPLAWFVDLALLGTGVGGTALGALSALTVVGAVVALAPTLATGVVRRLWTLEPSGKRRSSGSRSLVRDGWLERLGGHRVSRPVRTVARRRWLGERRVPRGLLNTGYVLFVVGVFVLPAFTILGGPLLLVIALALGIAAGIAVGSDPIETEYRALPMLLTAVDGREFVDGFVLAATVAGAVLVTVVVGPLGLATAGSLVTAALVLAGTAISACTAAVATAVGMGVDRDALAPIPFFFTDVPVYGETGSAPFRRLATVFAVVALVCAPAVLGNLPAVYGAAAGAGVPAVAVRVGAILVTAALAAAIAAVAGRIAVHRFRTYQLE